MTLFYGVVYISIQPAEEERALFLYFNIFMAVCFLCLFLVVPLIGLRALIVTVPSRTYELFAVHLIAHLGILFHADSKYSGTYHCGVFVSSCANPETIARWGPTLTTFFSLLFFLVGKRRS